jgi:hypothetical protein
VDDHDDATASPFYGLDCAATVTGRMISTPDVASPPAQFRNDFAHLRPDRLALGDGEDACAGGGPKELLTRAALR